jgi:hypothetical protein
MVMGPRSKTQGGPWAKSFHIPYDRTFPAFLQL